MPHLQTVAESHEQSYAAHKRRWEHCTRCPLHQSRKRVVLYRGQLPCDVLFVGEAPGRSEDLIGLPFVGEAGRLLDRIIADAFESLPKVGPYQIQMGGEQVYFTDFRRIAFTNIVCCLPTTDGEPRAPNKGEAEACRGRLMEFVELSSPRLVVLVGQVAERFYPIRRLEECAVQTMIHPAAILRQDPKQQTLSYKRCVLSLSRALGELK